MGKRVNLKNVALEAGVSVATVSQVMRGAGRISADTRNKVLDAARRLHYVPDGRAASMRSGENREIGFVIHQIANPFNSEVISGVSDLLENEGYLVSVLDSRDDAKRQKRNLEAFIRSSRGGLLWVPAEDTPDNTFDLLSAHHIPTVTFLRRLQSTNLDHVGIQNAEGIAAATRHLIHLGHTRLAYLGGTAHAGVRMERIDGLKKTAHLHGLPDPIVWESPDDKLHGLDAMLALHKAHPEITGIVCNGDMIALGALLAASKAGLSVGRDLSIVGFDGIQDASVSTPPLTTMAVSPYKLGQKLARTLLDRLTYPDMPTTVSLVQPDLVVRSSTGPLLSPG